MNIKIRRAAELIGAMQTSLWMTIPSHPDFPFGEQIAVPVIDNKLLHEARILTLEMLIELSNRLDEIEKRCEAVE